MDKAPEKKASKIVKKLRNKYRLTVFNNSTYEERFTYQLTPINVIVAVGSILLFLGFTIVSIVVFTPLREFIPGYTATEIKRGAYRNAEMIDSLENELRIKSTYVNNLIAILNDEPMDDTTSNRVNAGTDYDNLDLSVSEQDSLFRAQYEENQKLSSEGPGALGNMAAIHFFKPVSGYITDRFDYNKKHFGVDIVAPQDELIKAAKAGTVIQSAYTSEHGNVIQILHENNFITFYKHNKLLLKNIGDKVKDGEAIAIIGNTGEESSGPHLHFEIWRNGQPEDPEKYIVFE